MDNNKNIEDLLNIENPDDVEVAQLGIDFEAVDYSRSGQILEVWMYKLFSFQGKSISKAIKAAGNRRTLTVTNINDYISFKAVPASAIVQYELKQLYDPNSTENVQFKNVYEYRFNTQYSKNDTNGTNLVKGDILKFIDSDDCYIITRKKLTNENFDDIEKLMVTGMDLPETLNTDLIHFGFRCVPVEDWSDMLSVKPLIIINANPNVTSQKIKAITIKSPQGTFLSKLALTTKDGLRPPLMPSTNQGEETYMYPKLMFPFQVSPTVELLDWWNSTQFIQFKEIFDFLTSKNLKPTDQFSLKDFLKTSNVSASVAENYLGDLSGAKFHFKGASWRLKTVTSTHIGADTTTTTTYTDYSNSEIDLPINVGDLSTGENTKQVTFSDNKISSVDLWSAGQSSTGQTATQKTTIELKFNKIIGLTYKQDSTVGTTELFKCVLDMLNFSYNLKRNFAGATKIENGNETVDNSEIYALLKASQDAGDAITAISNIFQTFLSKYPNTQDAYPGMVRRAKWVLAALSQDIISNFAYNKGNTDDYKLVMPFYLKIMNAPTNSQNDNSATPFGDIIVKLESLFGVFTDEGFKFTDQNIAKNKSYQLSTNLASFPDAAEQIESASIPSTNPADVNLTNGEFYKYLVYKISTNKDWLFYNYGTGETEYDRYDDEVSEGKFIVKEANNFAELTISGINLNGEWNIAFDFEDDTNVDFKFTLGSAEEEARGFYLLNL